MTEEQFYDLLWLKSHQQVLPFLIKQKEPENAFIKLFSEVASKEEFEELWIKFKEAANNYHNYHYRYHYHYRYYYYHYYHYYYHYCYDLLLLIAKIGLETYQELKSPGCEFLYLVEEMNSNEKANIP